MNTGGFYWIASYPKSGNTWMRLLLTSVQAGGAAVDFDAPLRFAPLAGQPIDAEAALDVEPSDLGPEELTELRPDAALLIARDTCEPQFRKVHDCWGRTPSGRLLFPPEATLGSLYIVRDPRDVAVSWAHHSGRTIDRAIEFMAQPSSIGGVPGSAATIRQSLLSWSDHVLSWLSAEPRPLVVRYEDMLADTAGELARAAVHCGLSPSQSAIAGAVAATRFPVLRAEEDEKGFDIGQAAGRRFFRRGEAGGWRDTLTAAQAERMAIDHREVMARLGYF